MCFAHFLNVLEEELLVESQHGLRRHLNIRVLNHLVVMFQQRRDVTLFRVEQDLAHAFEGLETCVFKLPRDVVLQVLECLVGWWRVVLTLFFDGVLSLELLPEILNRRGQISMLLHFTCRFMICLNLDLA